jgi:hypothetical protein
MLHRLKPGAANRVSFLMVQSYPGHIPIESIARKFCVNCLSSGVIEWFPRSCEIVGRHAYAGVDSHADENQLRDCRRRGNCKWQVLFLLFDQSLANVRINKIANSHC